MAYTQEQLLKLAQGDPNFSTEYTYSQVQPTIAANKSKYASFLKNTKKHDLTVLNDKLDYTNTMNEIGKYIKLAKGDYISSLKKLDSNLADALQTATEGYAGQNLLGSGVAVARSTEMMNDQQMAKDGAEAEKKNTMDKYNDLRNQTIAKYEQITKPVNEMSKPEYKPGTPMNQAEYAKKYYIPAGMSLQQ